MGVYTKQLYSVGSRRVSAPTPSEVHGFRERMWIREANETLARILLLDGEVHVGRYPQDLPSVYQSTLRAAAWITQRSQVLLHQGGGLRRAGQPTERQRELAWSRARRDYLDAYLFNRLIGGGDDISV